MSRDQKLSSGEYPVFATDEEAARYLLQNVEATEKLAPPEIDVLVEFQPHDEGRAEGEWEFAAQEMTPGIRVLTPKSGVADLTRDLKNPMARVADLEPVAPMPLEEMEGLIKETKTSELPPAIRDIFSRLLSDCVVGKESVAMQKANEDLLVLFGVERENKEDLANLVDPYLQRLVTSIITQELNKTVVENGQPVLVDFLENVFLKRIFVVRSIKDLLRNIMALIKKQKGK